MLQQRRRKGCAHRRNTPIIEQNDIHRLPAVTLILGILYEVMKNEELKRKLRVMIAVEVFLYLTIVVSAVMFVYIRLYL